VEGGIVHREVYGSKPPLVTEYSLSPYGRTLCSIIEQMWNWGELHLKRSQKVQPPLFVRS
jgi:DNA-binding HxlR family transcriptional regulator